MHPGDKAYIVGISEETNTGNNASTDVVPSERSLVDLSKSETSSLIGVLDVSEVIVEVVEGGVSTRRLGDGDSCLLSSHCVERCMSSRQIKD